MNRVSYDSYLLTILLVILACNNTDGLAFGLLLQNIKSDLQLTDTQLGFLTGVAFAAFYALMGLPIARWADRGNRVLIISACAALWSVMVASSGAAAGFVQLLLIRSAVAIGESGCIPPAYSLIGDHFERARRPRALAIYLLGGNVSFLIGYFLTGWLNEAYGWRRTFVFLGLPGLLPALLAWLTLKEPRRLLLTQKDSSGPGRSDELGHPAQGSTSTPTIREVAVTLWSKAAFRHLLLWFSVATFFSSGVLQWLPAFFVRSYGLKTGQLGTWFGLIWGVGGLAGTYWGGALASRYAANNERLQLKTMAVAYVAFTLFSAVIYLSTNHYIGLAAMAIAGTGLAMTNGPALATIQTLAPPSMRATSVALIYLCSNLIGMGLGPLTVGALSDALHPAFHEESLRYALLALSPGYLWAAWHLWRASKTITRDIEAAQDVQRSGEFAAPAGDAMSATTTEPGKIATLI